MPKYLIEAVLTRREGVKGGPEFRRDQAERDASRGCMPRALGGQLESL
jgi:hypothetical protein